MFNTKGKMLQDIVVSLGGRVAEELVFDDITTGASQDIKQATQMAKAMVTKYGMSDNIGLICYDNDDDEVFIGRDLAHTRGYSEGVASAIDQEIKRIIDESYAKAKQMEGMTGENLMRILESRLDNVIFRMGLARTRKEARQIVDHKHVLVNGKQVNIPSYLVKAGDTIEIKENKKGSQRYKDILEATGSNMVPEWLDVDAENLKGSVKELPAREAIDVPVDEMLIVELYSK